MTANTEALRKQFEREIGEAAPFPVERDGDSYINRMCAWAWEGYQAGQAGHAAAAPMSPVTRAEIAACLRALSRRMIACGTAMDVYGSETMQAHGLELIGAAGIAAGIAAGLADGIEGEQP